MNGVLRCLRYAFGPNRLHLCGPEANSALLGYLLEQRPANGLFMLLRQFKTMYPYLSCIARANYIRDPFDDRVVEAYWLGNELLDNIGKKDFYCHLKDELKINSMVGNKDFEVVCQKLNRGATMHHSFHVMNIWKRTGNDSNAHTIDSIDKCRVGWGKILTIDGPFLTIEMKSLIYDKNRDIVFTPEFTKKVVRKLDDDKMLDLSIGDVISLHWDVPCEILTNQQVINLEKYTIMSMRLANEGKIKSEHFINGTPKPINTI